MRIHITWTAYWANLGFLSTRPYWVTVHGKEIGLRSSWLFKQMQRLVYLRAKGIISISEYTRAELVRTFPEMEYKVRMIHHGLTCDDRPPRMMTGSVIRILSIGQWIPRKGFDVLIDAVNRLSDRVDLRLDILTDGVKPEWESERVQIHPSVTEDEKSRYFAEASFFVLANRHIGSDFEGFGYVVLEAMAHALPCVVGRDGGPAELIRHGQDGFVVDADSVDELCSALETLCADAGLRDRMGRSAKQHANDRFSEGAFQNRMLEVLTE